MNKFVITIVILLLNVLSSNAQYALMTLGERNPFDSAVAIRLDTYRLETRKLELADELIGNLTRQVAQNEDMILSLNTQLIISNNMLQVKEDIIQSKQLTIDNLLKKIEYKPDESWWDKNHKPVIFVGGVSVGIGGVLLILNSIK